MGIFGIGDFSHSLLILAATQILTPAMGVVHAAQVAGLLYVWRNVVQVALSYPVGVLADRFGSRPVLVAGYGLGVAMAVLMAITFALSLAQLPMLMLIFFLAGLYVAAQEALESTVTADMVAPETLTTSYGALGTVNGAAKFVSSAAVGVLWTAVSPTFSFGVASVLMALGVMALLRAR